VDEERQASGWPWPSPELVEEFRAAVLEDPRARDPRTQTRWVGIDGGDHSRLTLSDIVEVVRWHVSYGHVPWQPGRPRGTELLLCAVLRLTGGRWASVMAQNGQRGWSGDADSQVRVGPDEHSVVSQGLDQASRELLGYT
jgi:hypothetical protein